jgi:predicted short-subunit dehydrogenase-like oxidoreductase (DUF2520 family)
VTPPDRGPDRLWIVGPGRVGLALGLLLHRARATSSLTYTGRAPEPPPHPLFLRVRPRARYLPGVVAPREGTTGLLLAVPDAAVGEVVAQMAEAPLPPGLPVLHLSGSQGAEVLEPLARRGCSVGGVHPLCAVADPVEGVQRLRGAVFAVEGEDGARELAERIVRAAGGTTLSLEPGSKPLYHAAAVFASNFLVSLLSVAERLMERAGVPAERVREALLALAQGALENVHYHGPAGALTGPVVRGDVETVLLHLSRLSGDERALYSLLGREALALARERGMDPRVAERMREALGENA